MGPAWCALSTFGEQSWLAILAPVGPQRAARSGSTEQNSSPTELPRAHCHRPTFHSWGVGELRSQGARPVCSMGPLPRTKLSRLTPDLEAVPAPSTSAG